MNEVFCMGHGGHVAASDMMTNFQHKHHICKACHANIIKAHAKEKKNSKAQRVAENISTAHDKARAEVSALMSNARPSRKPRASLYSVIQNWHDDEEMRRIVAGYEL